MKTKRRELDDSFLEINQLKLDEEWVNQPKLYFKYAQRLADARRDLDRAKSRLDLTRAELDRAVRADPEEYDMTEKPSNPAIEAAVLSQPEYEEANDTVLDAKHAVDVLTAVTTALDHRKRALENLVDLHGQNYFASPRASENNREAMEEVEERAIRQRGQRRRRPNNNDDE